MKLSHLFIFSTSLSLLLASCGSGGDKNNNGGNDSTNSSLNDTGKLDELKEFKYDMVISNIPIPFDILSVLKKSSVNFNKSILNDPASLNKYSSSNIKAVNLGIYGGDMAYVISFEQFSEVGSYLKSTKKLADELGIPIAFDQKTLSDYNKFKDNKDSLEKIVFSSYTAVDKTLKSNERLGLASLVVTGGWIEGLYTTTKTLGDATKNDANKALFAKIIEQKVNLGKLIGLLGEFSTGDTFYAVLTADLGTLKTIYDGLKMKDDLSKEELTAIRTKIEEIRNRLTNG